MALRAIISQGTPDAMGDWDELWYGSVGPTDDEEASGVTTAAILSFVGDAQPGVWYQLAEFERLVKAANWNNDAADWTSLTLSDEAVGTPLSFVADIKLEEAVSSVCAAACELLNSLDKKNVWVRFE